MVSTISLRGELWADIPGWPEYKVSNLGNIMRTKRAYGATAGKVISQRKTKNGYVVVSLCRNSVKKDMTVHRLVASAWIGEIPPGMDVCHNDGDKENNASQNLRIDTRKGNMLDTLKHGTTNRGERCGSNKYSREKILAFRSDVDSGMKVAQASRKHGISYQYAYSVAKRITWAWL